MTDMAAPIARPWGLRSRAAVARRRAQPTGSADLGPDSVRIEALTKEFGARDETTTVLERIDLTVRKGEFLALVGASGCGKSTLLSLIAGLARPTSGSVQVDGGQPALMFQESALFPWLTARENIELAMRLRGIGQRERRETAETLLAQVHLSAVADNRPHQLSGGQRQRVAMARSLAQGARVLLMDEPFAALDAITRDLLHSDLVSLWQETGISIVFVTHNVREAVRLAQRVVLLSSRPGRVVREWRVDQAQPRAIEDRRVGSLAASITSSLREQILAHV